jgi:hypothetical protein
MPLLPFFSFFFAFERLLELALQQRLEMATLLSLELRMECLRSVWG